MSDEQLDPSDDAALFLQNTTAGSYVRFAMAVLGVIPWVGAVISATAALAAEKEQQRFNAIVQRWLEEHDGKLMELQDSMSRVVERVETLGEESRHRLNSEAFLPLVRRAYRGWDRAQTEEKRALFERLLTNAAGTRVSDDDVVRLFIDWIDRYDETHFRIISEVHRQNSTTRLGIWRALRGSGPLPREDSSDADLYRVLIRDLSTGGLLRQRRQTDAQGRFLKKSTKGQRRSPPSPFMKSSFDNEELYELSELGGEFVHYVLSDSIRRLDG